MIVISVLAEKGGVGKTTTALALAVAAVRDGKRAAVIDVDPQATAANWTDRRTEELPWVVPSPAPRLRQAVETARTQGVDVLVIDTPPNSGTTGAEAARLSDLVILAIEPHVFALETLPKLRDLLRIAGDPPAFVLITKAPVQGREAQDTAAHVQTLGFTVCPVFLYLRAAHRHAGNAGQAAAEYEPTGKAAAESQQVYLYTCQQVHKSRSKQHGKAQSVASGA